MSSEMITVEATLAAPVERVWTAYTTPEDITQWNFASDDWCCPSAENDLTVGGKYKARMEAKDGSFGFDFEAVYDEVEPLKSITLAMTDGRRVRTTFDASEGATTVTTVFDADPQNSIDMQRDGWQAILNNFKTYVEVPK
jgi:uncharacterized protein YndB with AHSA1/START domain